MCESPAVPAAVSSYEDVVKEPLRRRRGKVTASVQDKPEDLPEPIVLKPSGVKAAASIDVCVSVAVCSRVFITL